GRAPRGAQPALRQGGVLARGRAGPRPGHRGRTVRRCRAPPQRHPGLPRRQRRRVRGADPMSDETTAAESNKLVLKDVTFGYGPTPTVEDINLHVERGEMVALLGGNGAGKSTVLKL